MYFQIKPDRRRRSKSRKPHIIITHAHNLILKENTFSYRDLLKGSYKYSWGKFQNYLIHHVDKYSLPMHYYIELIDKDYAVMKGLSDHKPSYFLDELVNKGIIKAKYKHSILIVIGEDFDLYNPDVRLLRHLSDKVLVPLATENKVDFNHIVTLEDCYTDNYLDKLENNRFETKPMRRFDINILKQIYNIYNVMR